MNLAYYLIIGCGIAALIYGFITAKQVLGTKIMIQGDTAIGTVDDIVFDNAGNLEYLIVENEGKLAVSGTKGMKVCTCLLTETVTDSQVLAVHRLGE